MSHIDTALPSALRVRRQAVIAAAGLSGLLVLVSMFVDPVPQADGRDLIVGYAGDLTRSGLHTNLIHYGFALVAPVVYAMVSLVRGPGAWLGNAAGVLAVIGLSTLPGLVLLDFTTVATALSADVDAAVAMEEQMGQLGWFLAIVIPAFLAAMVALPLALAATWRAGLVSGWLPLLAVITTLTMQFSPVWWIGFGANAVTMLMVAYCLARIPTLWWYGGSTAVAADRNPVEAVPT
jgi:hypothetical protein